MSDKIKNISNVITKEKIKKTGKSVLLFSGGMDSLIFDKLINPDILLYIPSGSNYVDIETKKINELCDKGIIDRNKLIILDNVLNLKQFERDDMIVPQRNAFLIMLAAMYGEEIYLGSVYGDRSLDKSIEFFEKMEVILNQMWGEQHWTEERKFKILDPYKDTTKTELVKKYIELGYDPNDILVSYSCYEGFENPCGCCKPCTRKFISLVNNNVKIPENYFKTNPLEAEWLVEVYPKMLKGEYRGKEDFEFLNVLQKDEKFMSKVKDR